MLLGTMVKKPSLETVRHIKRTLREVLELPEDTTITVSQLACLEQGCAPVETVIGLLCPNQPQRQHKIHKPTEELRAEDLVEVCEAWSLPVELADIEPFFKES